MRNVSVAHLANCFSLNSSGCRHFTQIILCACFRLCDRPISTVIVLLRSYVWREAFGRMPCCWRAWVNPNGFAYSCNWVGPFHCNLIAFRLENKDLDKNTTHCLPQPPGILTSWIAVVSICFRKCHEPVHQAEETLFLLFYLSCSKTLEVRALISGFHLFQLINYSFKIQL